METLMENLHLFTFEKTLKFAICTLKKRKVIPKYKLLTFLFNTAVFSKVQLICYVLNGGLSYKTFKIYGTTLKKY